MAAEHTSTDFLSAQYTIHAKQVDGRFIVWIDELGLSADGENLNEAHQNLENTKSAHFERCIAVGKNPAAPEEFGKRSRDKTSVFMPFAIKSAIAALLIVVTIFSVQIVVTRTIANLPRNAATIVVNGIDRLGQTSQWVSDERMRDIGRKIGLLYKNMLPMFEEIDAAIQERDGSSKPGGTVLPSEQ